MDYDNLTLEEAIDVMWQLGKMGIPYKVTIDEKTKELLKEKFRISIPVPQQPNQAQGGNE